VFAVWFMGNAKREGKELDPVRRKRRTYLGYGLYALTTLMLYIGGNVGLGHFAVMIVFLVLLYKFVISKGVRWFQEDHWPAVQRYYASFLRWTLKRPWTMMTAMVVLLLASCGITMTRQTNIVLFPTADPNFIYVYMTLPVGTDME